MKVSFYQNGQIKTFTGDLEDWGVVLSTCSTDSVVHEYIEEWCGPSCNPEDSLHRIVDAS